MIRRSFLKLLGVTLPGLLTGPEEKLFLSMTLQGQDVTERVPVTFRWLAKMKVSFAEGHDFVCDGSAVYTSLDADRPLADQSFDKIHVMPTDTLNLSWILRPRVEAAPGLKQSDG